MEDYRSLFKNEETLVIGGLGFIGSNLAKKLVELGSKVTILDSLSLGFGGNKFNIKEIEDKINLNIDDASDMNIVSRFVKDKKYIFNLAGQVSHVKSMEEPIKDLETNCKIPLVVLEACKKFNKNAKVIYTGTRGQYGSPLYTPVDENHPQNPMDINGIHKMAAEKYHLLYSKSQGIKTVCLRLTNTYGPRHQMQDPTRGFIAWFIRLAIDNETIKVFGDGKQVRDMNYVGDVVDGILASAASDKTNGEVYNLGGQTIELLPLAKMVVDICGSGKYQLVPYEKEFKKVEIGSYIANIKKIKETTGWEPKVSLEDGLKRTIKYYKEHKSEYW